MFFIANALTRCKRQAEGATAKACEDGLEMERALREKLNAVEFRDARPHNHVPEAIYLKEFLVLPDVQGPVKVWLVDGNPVRSFYKTDYTQGGHGYVYAWVPRSEIWIEDGDDHREIAFIVTHEYLERRLMRDRKFDYDSAHAICSRVEFDIRKKRGARPLLASGWRKLQKKDLARLTHEEVFQYALRNYEE